MFEKIRKLLKSQSATDIRAALAELDIGKLRGELDAAKAKRTALLLAGTDDQVLAAEKEVEAARLAFERAEAARGELETKLAVADAAEWDAAFQKQWDAADAEAKAAFDFIRTKVVPAVRVIEEALERKAASDASIREINRIITAHSYADNAASRAGFPQNVMDRIGQAETLPGWVAVRFERHSQAH